MKYLIVGAGGTGGCVGAFLAEKGNDVTFIARGVHLAAIKEKGLFLHSDIGGEIHIPKAKAFSMEEYEGMDESPDVIFLCVKGYSLKESIAFLKKIVSKHSFVIPILNIYGTGEALRKEIPWAAIADGCIYVSSFVSAPGEIKQLRSIFKVVYGSGKGMKHLPIMEQVAKDLIESGVWAEVSDNIVRDAYKKFSYVSAVASVGAYYNAYAKDFQKQGEKRDTLIAMFAEAIKVATEGLAIVFDTDVVKDNIQIIDNLGPDADASMQRDLRAGKQSEIDGLLFEVVRMARNTKVEVPVYEKIAKHFGFEE